MTILRFLKAFFPTRDNLSRPATVRENRTTEKESYHIADAGKMVFTPAIYPPYGFVRLEDFAVMVATLYCECRSEPREGILAVAHVILNRAKARTPSGKAMWWGGTIYDVCTQPWQFSCWNAWPKDGTLNERKQWANKQKGLAVEQALLEGRTSDLDKSALQCYAIALEALQATVDPTGGATHYHTYRVNPEWAEKGKWKTKNKIGNHFFYTGVK